MMMRAIAFLAVVCAASAEDYKRWKEMRAQRSVIGRVQTVYEAKEDDVDACFKVAETFPEVGDNYGAYFHTGLSLCQIFEKKPLGKYDESDDSMEWSEVNTRVEVSPEHNLYVKKDNKDQEDDITAGGIVATIVLAIIFVAMMVACAFLCKEEDSDISNQMERLKERELKIEREAGSEWEARSQAEEEMAKKEA